MTHSTAPLRTRARRIPRSAMFTELPAFTGMTITARLPGTSAPRTYCTQAKSSLPWGGGPYGRSPVRRPGPGASLILDGGFVSTTSAPCSWCGGHRPDRALVSFGRTPRWRRYGLATACSRPSRVSPYTVPRASPMCRYAEDSPHRHPARHPGDGVPQAGAGRVRIPFASERRRVGRAAVPGTAGPGGAVASTGAPAPRGRGDTETTRSSAPPGSGPRNRGTPAALLGPRRISAGGLFHD